MCDNSDSGVIQVEPGGNLPVSDNEDVSHPGGVSLHGAQRVAQLLVVLEPARRHVFILFGLKREGLISKYLDFNGINSLHLFFCLTERSSRT